MMVLLGGKLRLSFSQILAMGFALIIVTGTLLLMLPAASRDSVPLPFIDALFTAASASCVTGLVVCDTYSQFTLFGQIVILVLIQIGGLGFMTIAILFSMILKKKIGLKERGLLMESVSTLQIGGVVRLVRRILLGTAVFELAGAALLSLRFCQEFGLGTGLWYGLFHAVSAFCNAGFDILGRITPYGSLVPYAHDPLVILPIAALIVVGGVGFVVWDDIWEHRGRFSRYRLHTKIVLVTTATLIVVPVLLFLLLERDASLAGRAPGEKLLCALFQAITPRTAGFNSVPIDQMSSGGTMLTMILMFVGASPGSTAGGIKTTTLVVMLLSLVSYARHQDGDLNIFHRRLETGTLRRAYCSAGLYGLMALTGCFLLTAVQGFSIEDTLYEALSAIGTVGLTRGITQQLNLISKMVIILLMYAGRVGSLSVAVAVARRTQNVSIKNPEAKITIG